MALRAQKKLKRPPLSDFRELDRNVSALNEKHGSAGTTGRAPPVVGGPFVIQLPSSRRWTASDPFGEVPRSANPPMAEAGQMIEGSDVVGPAQLIIHKRAI